MANPTALTFNGWLSAVAALAVETTTTVSGVNQFTSPALQALVPQILNYSELRIQRDCDLNQLSTSNAYAFTANNNVLAIPLGDFVAVQTMSVNGAPLTPVSREFLQNVWGTSTGAAQPSYFAPYGGDSNGGNTSTNFIVGPWPDQAYSVTVTGLTRSPSLYVNATPSLAGSATTFISSWLPDLLIQASLIMVAEYQRNFGPTSNDPQMGLSYEQQYQALLKGAIVEEARRRFQSGAWGSQGPTPIATPTR